MYTIIRLHSANKLRKGDEAVKKELIEKLQMIAEASGKTMDDTYSNSLNGNMMTVCEKERQIKFTHYSDRKGGDDLARVIIDEMQVFSYKARLESVEISIDPIWEFIITY